ncbi:tetratricopeptide repeat protein [Sulfurimonas sp. CVO]|jgi:tetratricopeptide (TPR) repeat protein|uniref:Tetratricopeptide repeat protein n=1 Tax=Sulfurimonas xiamenensis TaxID=2590021 RepID=A0AAJ4A2T2_9BACT|nr:MULTISPECIES: tetratricopeptide repeat protein [Sulfurimonas]QFR42903.1 tetratricopeptide repeat protein [Sulfurimonas xiamenensis]QHG91551.1 tetratricopeptide repeat protein [Sulfurimonas sp. CVO]
MNLFLKFFTLVFFLFFSSQLSAQNSVSETTDKSLEKPLVERYILDELKDLRVETIKLKADVEKRLSRAEIEQTDRAARYITDTIGNVFYLIAAATSILIFAGWNSLRDIRSKTEKIVEERIDTITKKYNTQLEALQNTLSQQSKKILDNQNKIYNTQYIHSLWMRSNLETNPQSRIDIYDEILKINDNDAEVYAYKADAVLDMDEYEWALSLSNKAIEIDPQYGYAYWQRACANAVLGNKHQAIEDLQTAVENSPQLKDEINNEKLFENIKESEEFKKVVALFN